MVNGSRADKVLFDQGCEISHKISRTHHMEKAHFHDGFEIHFTLTDGTSYYIDGREYNAPSGTVAAINKREIHRVCVPKDVDYERWYLYFQPKDLEPMLSEYSDLLLLFTQRFSGFENCLTLTAEKQARLLNMFHEFESVYESKDIYMRDLRIKQHLIGIIVFLNEEYLERSQLQMPLLYKQSNQIAQMTEYIKQHVQDGLTLDGLCRQFFLSKSTIIRLFNKYLGMTPVQYIIYVRIMKSRQYLEDGLSIREVAYRSGYQDESSFIKKFKMVQGISPKQYAKRVWEVRHEA